MHGSHGDGHIEGTNYSSAWDAGYYFRLCSEKVCMWAWSTIQVDLLETFYRAAGRITISWDASFTTAVAVRSMTKIIKLGSHARMQEFIRIGPQQNTTDTCVIEAVQTCGG